eukprot:TRINITY_DN8762_c0_g1_i1.p1 TRINITY_DN8762_c0_g1~~TRINITY_DN8762_c0_g1_i1.p1  ORF type:complete len:466 (+),score=36.07 TRINITY_DN8762_c0_g1_i1:24-1421(+)
MSEPPLLDDQLCKDAVWKQMLRPSQFRTALCLAFVNVFQTYCNAPQIIQAALRVFVPIYGPGPWRRRIQHFGLMRLALDELISEGHAHPSLQWKKHMPSEEEKTLLLGSTEVQYWMQLWFRALCNPNTAHNGIAEPEYIGMCARLYLCLMPNPSPVIAREVAAEDWQHDNPGVGEMDFFAFSVGVLNYALLWCVSNEEAEIVDWLSTVYVRVCTAVRSRIRRTQSVDPSNLDSPGTARETSDFSARTLSSRTRESSMVASSLSAPPSPAVDAPPASPPPARSLIAPRRSSRARTPSSRPASRKREEGSGTPSLSRRGTSSMSGSLLPLLLAALQSRATTPGSLESQRLGPKTPPPTKLSPGELPPPRALSDIMSHYRGGSPQRQQSFRQSRASTPSQASHGSKMTMGYAVFRGNNDSEDETDEVESLGLATKELSYTNKALPPAPVTVRPKLLRHHSQLLPHLSP